MTQDQTAAAAAADRSQDTEPDYRFTLANERTFLSWIRTALGLLAGGIAVVSLAPHLAVPGGRRMLGVPLIVLSAAVAARSYSRWAAVQQAMRRSRPLPPSRLPRILSLGVGAVAAIALVLILLGAT